MANRKPPVLVEQYGYVYQLAASNYERLLSYIKTGREYDLEKLGKELGPIRTRPLGMSKQAAADELERFRGGI